MGEGCSALTLLAAAASLAASLLLPACVSSAGGLALSRRGGWRARPLGGSLDVGAVVVLLAAGAGAGRPVLPDFERAERVRRGERDGARRGCLAVAAPADAAACGGRGAVLLKDELDPKPPPPAASLPPEEREAQFARAMPPSCLLTTGCWVETRAERPMIANPDSPRLPWRGLPRLLLLVVVVEKLLL